jgi:tRNA nucleotidyltransferase (CCA-adding enzyme)
MSTQVETIKENTNVEQISAKLFAGQFNGVSVVDDNDSVIGVVSAIDILKAIREGRKLNTIVAKDIMSPNPSVIKKDTPINDVIDIMIKRDIIMVPVVEDNTDRIIGVVARLDIITEKLKEGLIT